MCWALRFAFALYCQHFLMMFPLVSGALVDKTGHYYHVFLACSAVVASAAVFLMVTFCWLDKRDRKLLKQGQPSALPDPARPAVDVAPGCQYSSVPTEGDKVKASANGAEFITSVWTCSHCAALGTHRALGRTRRFCNVCASLLGAPDVAEFAFLCLNDAPPADLVWVVLVRWTLAIWYAIKVKTNTTNNLHS